MNNKPERFKITDHMVAFAIFLGVLIWIGKSIINSTLSRDWDLLHEIFTPEIHDLWMRLVFISILILFGVLTQTLISRSTRAEAALQVSERKYRSFIETLTDFVFTLDLDGRLTYINPRAEAITGFPTEKILGRTITEVLAPEYHEFALDAFNRGLAGEITPIYEAEVLDRTGRRIPIEVNVNTLWDDQGKAIGRIGVARNITDRKRIEAALRESEEKFRVLAESTPTAILLYQDNNWVYANPAAERISGYTKEEFIKMNFWDIVHPDYQDMIRQRAEDRRRGLPVEPRQEFIICSKDGREIWVDFTGDRTMFGGSPAVIVSVNDITERKRAEQVVKENEEKYRTILQSIEDGYFELDLAGNMIFHNDQLCTISGFTREELIGLNYRDYTTPQWRQRLFKIFHEVYATGITLKQLDWEAINKDGATIYLEISVSLIKDAAGSAKGFRGIVRDVTERKQLEVQLHHAQKMEAIGTLAGGIAHDFNNLLMSIQGNASLMSMDLIPDHPHQLKIRHIEQCVSSGSELTRQLLGFARKGKYEVKATDLNEIILKTSDMFAHTRKEITIRRKFQGGIWCVEVDQGQMEQVLLNLYLNAWQAMPGGGELFLDTANVIIDVHSARTYQVKPGRYVQVSVRDTGEGMDKAVMARIFDPFFTTKDMSRSSGLGLASAYGIIRNHEGVLTVASEKAKGSTFTIYLPASNKDIARREEPLDNRILKGDETVLLVDDEDMILEIGSDILRKLGYEVLPAQSGEQALDIFSKDAHSIDLVVLDMIMPGMGGSQTYDELRKLKDDVRVILSSGYSLNGQAEDILKRGCNGFIQKPFSISTFSRKIREVLE